MNDPDRLAEIKAHRQLMYGPNTDPHHFVNIRLSDLDWLVGEVDASARVPNDLDGTHCPCVTEHNPDPAEDEVHHLVPLGAPFHGADVVANKRRLCGTQHGTVHVLLRLILRHRALGQPVPRDRIVHFSPFSRRLAGVAVRALDSGVDRPTTPDLDWVEVTFRR